MELFAKRITVTKEVNEKIKRTFNCTGQTVYNALTFDEKCGYSDKAKRIRVMALQNGGILMAQLPIEEMIHDSDNCMRQYFANDVMLEADKDTGDVVIYHRGVMVDHYHAVTIQQLKMLQELAKNYKEQAS